MPLETSGERGRLRPAARPPTVDGLGMHAPKQLLIRWIAQRGFADPSIGGPRLGWATLGLPPVKNSWRDRQPFEPDEQSKLEPAPKHYLYQLDL